MIVIDFRQSLCNSGIFALYVIAVLLLNFSHTGLNIIQMLLGSWFLGALWGSHRNLLPADWNTPENQKFPKFPHFSKLENVLKGFSKAKRVEKPGIFLGVRTIR